MKHYILFWHIRQTLRTKVSKKKNLGTKMVIKKKKINWRVKKSIGAKGCLGFLGSVCLGWKLGEWEKYGER